MKKLLLILAASIFLLGNTNTTFAQHKRKVQHKKHVAKEVIVYVTNTGGKYHSSWCSYLRRSSIPMKKNDALASGYGACSRCNP